MKALFRPLLITLFLIGYAAPALHSFQHVVQHSVAKASASSESETLRDSDCSVCDGLANLTGTLALHPDLSSFLAISQARETLFDEQSPGFYRAVFPARAPPALV